MVRVTVMSKKNIEEIEKLIESLENCIGENDRLIVISGVSLVQQFLAKYPWLKEVIQKLRPIEVLAIKSVIAIGQGETVFSHYIEADEKFYRLVENLVQVESFYDTIGGIIGYHLTVLRLIEEGLSPAKKDVPEERYYQAPGVNIMDVYGSVNQSIKEAIEALPRLAEMYPVGGAGDRLSLKDEETGGPLPAAVLPFLGHSLLTGLVRDLQAREYLYYKITGRQLTTPLSMMTSYEKDNHQYLLNILEKESWFGRPQESIRLFVQPLVPVISIEGEWVMQDPYHLSLKPGGHGVLWKKASDDGILNWFKELGRDKILVRQINNPIAGTDYGILAFLGIGFRDNKSFGFASCRRKIQAAEGMNVLVERKAGNEYSYCISNVEYTEFEKKGIQDVPASEGSSYSAFPANTNILFADIDTLKNALELCPIPGIIINMKSTFKHYTHEGSTKDVKGGRLESTMQNIADVIVDRFTSKQDPQEVSLSTYVTYNRRRKTLSVTKNSYEDGKSIHGTPPGGLYELLQNNHELLSEYCHMNLPELNTEEDYIKNGPSVMALFHPALGPCWSIIAQKIRGGKIAPNSELQLEIAEVDIENLELSGSLLVEAENPLGSKDSSGIIQYNEGCGKCVLKNVTVTNAGINKTADNVYWRNQISRNEALRIILQGNAEFYAENVTIEGDQIIEVPNGYRLVVTEKDGELDFDREPIQKPSWSWKYSFVEEDQIFLSK